MAEHPGEEGFESTPTPMVGDLVQVNEAVEESKAFNTQSSKEKLPGEINQYESIGNEVNVDDQAA